MDAEISTQKLGLLEAWECLERPPEEGIPRFLTLLDRFSREGELTEERRVFHRALQNPQSGWYQLLQSLWSETREDVRKTLCGNLVFSELLAGGRRRAELLLRGGKAPWMLRLFSEEDSPAAWDFDRLDALVADGREKGVYLFCCSPPGGKQAMGDLIALCNHWVDCIFLAAIPSERASPAFAAEAARVRNLVPILKEGGSAENLRAEKLFFGRYRRCGSKDIRQCGLASQLEQLVREGSKFCIFLPADADPPDSAEVRGLRRRLVSFRERRPLLALELLEGKAYPECLLRLNRGGIA